jgi:phage terminase small subunit
VRDLTEQQAIFVKEYVRNGGRGSDAAREAGFSEKSAGKYAWALMEKPHVLEAIHREQRRAFTELAAISLGQAQAMLEDPKTPAGARVELIKTVCDRAGLAALRNADEAPGEGKPLRDMSIEELEDIAASLRSQSARDEEEAEPVRRAA